MSSHEDEDEANAPPPPSQSHFAKFENFEPDDDAAFEDEFARLASSQEWAPGSQEYTRERTIAMREELKLHYFSQPLADIPEYNGQEPEELTEEQKLVGYQNLCREVGIPTSESIEVCKTELKSTLVNIVDLIDARRTAKVVQVWDDFEAFADYTMQEGKMINKEEALKGGGYLASLLQRIRGPNRKMKKRNRGGRRRGNGAAALGVASGRVMKREG